MVHNGDTINNDWLGYYKREFAYNHNGKITLEIVYYGWHINNDWFGYQKEVTTYDNNGNQTSVTRYNWDIENKDRNEYSKTE